MTPPSHTYSERAASRDPWTDRCSFVDYGDRNSARTAVPDYKYLVLVALPSARCARAVETYNSDGVLGSTWRANRTLCALRTRWARRSRRTRRPRRTWFAFFTRRPDRARFPFRPLTT